MFTYPSGDLAYDENMEVIKYYVTFGPACFELIHFLILFTARTRSKGKFSGSETSRISSQHMESIVEKLMQKQHRDSTAKTYLAIWRQFNKFTMKLDKKPKPWEDRTTLFIGYLIDRGIQSVTIKSYVSAIKKMLVMDGYK